MLRWCVVVVTDCVGYPNEDAVHVALKTVRDWLDKLHSQNKVSEQTGRVSNPLVRTPDFSILSKQVSKIISLRHN